MGIAKRLYQTRQDLLFWKIKGRDKRKKDIKTLHRWGMKLGKNGSKT